MNHSDRAWIEALEAERDNLNTRFARRRIAGARIDGAAFLVHVREVIGPLVRAVHAEFPERVRGTLVALYDLSLDLFAASLLGSERKMPYVERTWRELLPRVARLLAYDPQQIAGCLSNAVYNVAARPGSRPDEWIDRIKQVGSHCGSVAELINCGKVAAWLAGLVQYREAALRTAHSLAVPIACRLLLASPDASADLLQTALTRLEKDPWLTVAAAMEREQWTDEVRLVGTVGAFRGFGGLFKRPPTVRCIDGVIFAADGESEWKLVADAYGTLLHRVGEAVASRPKANGTVPVTVDRAGRVQWNGTSATFDHLGNASSYACNGITLAVTIPTSHHVFLLARPGVVP